ncbi:MAG: hypothetical protein U5N86_01795 [Planctomycetota bacterium]|nr:hypothetical protein [Planctomycetota bacterium]
MAVTDNGDEVCLVSVFEDLFRILVNFLAGRRYAGRVPDREIIEIANAAFRHDTDLSLIERVQFECISSGFVGLLQQLVNITFFCHFHSLG